MKKSVVLTNYLLLAVLILFTIGYDALHLLPFKWLASTSFVILAIVNFLYVKKHNAEKIKVAMLMLIGMIMAMGGDVSINFNFIVGAVVFAMGHIFYWITYCAIEKIRKSDLLLTLGLLLAILALLFLTPIFNFGDVATAMVATAYCVIISMMTAKGVMNVCRCKTKTNIFFACGSVMFLISDLMLVLNLFANTSDITFILCHSIYFPGQWVLAHGMFYLAEE